jgi:hypothetical protein
VQEAQQHFALLEIGEEVRAGGHGARKIKICGGWGACGDAAA